MVILDGRMTGEKPMGTRRDRLVTMETFWYIGRVQQWMSTN